MDFLLRVYAGARAAEMAAVPWTEQQKLSFLRSQLAVQTREYTSRYPQAEHSIVLVNGREVGRSFIVRQPDELHVLDVAVLPEERGYGVGSELVRRWQREAADAGVPLTICVETFNSSLSFFANRGFQATEQNGFHVQMTWKSPTKNAGSAS